MGPSPRGRLDSMRIGPDVSIREALRRLDDAGTGALVVCGNQDALLGLITDGDVRRGLLRGIGLDAPCESVTTRKPVTASPSISGRDALHLMSTLSIDHLPLVDDDGQLRDVLLRKDLVSDEDSAKSAEKRLESVRVPPSADLSTSLARLDQAGTGALVVCGPDGELLGLLTDGDIRRAVLRGATLDSPCDQVATKHPLTAPAGICAREALDIMTSHDVNHLPLTDGQGRVVELLLRRDLTDERALAPSAVIMAGGYGKRLLPLTKEVPKPMLPVGDRPLLEWTLGQLRRSGIRHVNLNTHFRSDSIKDHFGDGKAFGLELSYANEDYPLGTAGGLKLMERPSSSFVVINGDILTNVSFKDMVRFHGDQKAMLTIGVRRYEVDVPFGVVYCEEAKVVEVREKPALSFFVNAGVYVLEPEACDFIPDGLRFDMVDLIDGLLAAGRMVVSFPIVEYWQDIGRHGDYEQVQHDVAQGLV